MFSSVASLNLDFLPELVLFYLTIITIFIISNIRFIPEGKSMIHTEVVNQTIFMQRRSLRVTNIFIGSIHLIKFLSTVFYGKK